MPPDPTLPRYKCHKEVNAAKIIGITDPSGPTEESDGSRHLTFDGIEGSILVNHEFMRKHKPEVGGYYVVYEDGYTSYSPAKAFESGYAKIAG